MALHRRGALAAGENLLVLGAAGGVGSAAIQLGKAASARVIAVASGPEKGKYCTGLGADPPPTAPVVPVVPPATATAATHAVTSGEHLWSIAAATIAVRTGRSIEALSPADIAPSWARLVERNRARVRSGNPSLVYPGEVLELPL